MRTSLVALGLAAAATTTSAAPLAKKSYPPTSSSLGFVLVANVTDLSKNIFAESVNGWTLTGVHVGAGLDTAVLSNATSYGRVFWANGTAQEVHFGHGTVEADGGLYPYGISLSNLTYNSDGTPDPNNPVQYVGVNIGSGTPGVGVRPFSAPYADLYTQNRGTWAVCNETNPVYGRPQYPVRFVKSHFDDQVQEIFPVPDNCVAIDLLAQCAELPALQDGAVYNHDYAQSVRCYPDVSAIDWSQWSD